jgi:plasmid stabilization system protein ParE
MEYRVRLMPRAQNDVEELYQWVIHRAPHQGASWYNGLIEAIRSLAHHPQRCPIAPEGLELRESVRQLLYGRRPYRILFSIGSGEVRVLHIRRGARKQWDLTSEGQPS